mgnify:CR=1 FL=1
MDGQQNKGAPRRARLALALWLLGCAGMLALGAVSCGLLHRFGSAFPGLRITAIAALAAAGWFALGAHRLRTTVTSIERDTAGTWFLRAYSGKLLATIPPGTPRLLSLWAEVRSRESAPHFDSLQGRLQPDNGPVYRLRPATGFDLLIRLGYGPWWLDHEHLTAVEELQIKAGQAVPVFAGRRKSESLALPRHTADAAGTALVAAFLAGRSRTLPG